MDWGRRLAGPGVGLPDGRGRLQLLVRDDCCSCPAWRSACRTSSARSTRTRCRRTRDPPDGRSRRSSRSWSSSSWARARATRTSTSTSCTRASRSCGASRPPCCSSTSSSPSGPSPERFERERRIPVGWLYVCGVVGFDRQRPGGAVHLRRLLVPDGFPTLAEWNSWMFGITAVSVISGIVIYVVSQRTRKGKTDEEFIELGEAEGGDRGGPSVRLSGVDELKHDAGRGGRRLQQAVSASSGSWTATTAASCGQGRARRAPRGSDPKRIGRRGEDSVVLSSTSSAARRGTIGARLTASYTAV